MIKTIRKMVWEMRKPQRPTKRGLKHSIEYQRKLEIYVQGTKKLK